jgi:hypothetical protein
VSKGSGRRQAIAQAEYGKRHDQTFGEDVLTYEQRIAMRSILTHGSVMLPEDPTHEARDDRD